MRRFLLVAALLALGAAPVAAEDGVWDALRQGGLVVLVRHAATPPGTGDPPGFRLDDCRTQRNLSAEGRAQAIEIAAALARHQVPVGRVLSSRWCRCLETARLAFGRVEPEPLLDYLYGQRNRGPERSAALRALIAAEPKRAGNLFLVTHNSNIAALVNASPKPGEMIVVTPDERALGGLRVIGRVQP